MERRPLVKGAQDLLCGNCLGRGAVADFSGSLGRVVDCPDCAGTGLAPDVRELAEGLQEDARAIAAFAPAAGDGRARVICERLLALHSRLIAAGAGAEVLVAMAG
jgi:hypothetical protein